MPLTTIMEAELLWAGCPFGHQTNSIKALNAEDCRYMDIDNVFFGSNGIGLPLLCG